jgi:hypothetical protein
MKPRERLDAARGVAERGEGARRGTSQQRASGMEAQTRESFLILPFC